jgi:alkanesulfonate monooxygenase SsuD/methylene tetrahydromethanopterin reductase-like flavin-dependent oxidoreductase (luciferase family)
MTRLPLSDKIRFGVIAGALDGDGARRMVDSVARFGYDSLFTGDHIAFTGPISDPLTQIAYCGALHPKLTFGTAVYLLPLRHPTVVAKMVATVDRMLGANRFVFGIGVGGEFPREYEACGIPIKERGGRANESIRIIKRLWSEQRVVHQGKYFSFGEIRMEPKPATPNGPPIWVGGRAEGALKRAARLADGWVPYVVTPKRYADGLEFIAREAERVGRRIEQFGTAVFVFCTIADSYENALGTATEQLSRRYAMDFREPARKYGALGRPADVAEKIVEYIRAGAREILLDIVSRFEDRDAVLERFAREVMPMVRK